MDKLAIIILAAGKGTRMGASLPKVLFETNENSLLRHVLITACNLQPDQLVVVTGYQNDLVEQHASQGQWIKSLGSHKLSFAFQEKQLGTGDAVRAGLQKLINFSGTILILCGDVPLIEKQTLESLLSVHHSTKATLTLTILKGHLDNTYGKIVRDSQGQILKIVEHKDCSSEQKMIDETNAAIYAVDSAFLEPAITRLNSNNVQNEFYLTDIVEQAVGEGQTVNSLILTDHDQLQGVNTQWDLHMVNRSLRHKKIKAFAISGVIFDDPDSVYIDGSVAIAPGVKIGPNTIIKGNSQIAAGCIIEGCCYLKDCKLSNNTYLKLGIRAENTIFGDSVSAGPFANFRSGSQLDANVHVGNFVEVKNSHLKQGTKAGHLAYLGDAEIGENVNIGAGTIIANYDGINKYKTEIKDSAFIGSNSVLIAPIKIGNNATVGAGSVINKDVESNSLVVTRAPAKVKVGWLRAKKK